MARPITPSLAADVIVELEDRPGTPIVLIERKYEPLGWAIPGGFVEVGETVEQGARREIKEETGLDVELTDMLGVYSDPARDPRGHSVSVVYRGVASGNPRADDDALSVSAVPIDQVPPLVFDHEKIIQDYIRKFRA
ncbi:MAG: NUDIX hydrolase [Pseudomonadota bacterium]